MAKFIVLPESKSDHDYICFLMHQLRHYEKKFEEFHDPSDQLQVIDYQKLMDAWLKDNVVKVTQS